MILGARWEFWTALGAALIVAAVVLLRRFVVRRRVWLAAFLEQGRRELEHRGPRYRPDQRVRAIQQRLSRHFGKSALGPKMKRRVERALGLAN